MKKILALLMVLAMTAGFVMGCSGGQEGTTPSEEPVAQEEVQGETGEQAQEEAPAAGEVETEQQQ